MNALQLKKLFEIFNGNLKEFFKLSNQEKNNLATQLKFDDEQKLSSAINEYINTHYDPLAPTPKEQTAKEYLDNLPPNKRYWGACYLGRVFGDDMHPNEVLKEAGYSDDEIAEFERLAKL